MSNWRVAAHNGVTLDNGGVQLDEVFAARMRVVSSDDGESYEEFSVEDRHAEPLCELLNALAAVIDDRWREITDLRAQLNAALEASSIAETARVENERVLKERHDV